ncbi:MAG: Bug family tripartite tricarboxylate transporter substrate binding protein [bacterium]|jgi:tripartite-type tricarboxylate transporter receptor subunit TctC|nr:tripartite tricarboxylate transporter substrate binding protein [Betaproteobacteria bacterium]
MQRVKIVPAALLAGLAAASSMAWGQSYPTKPIRLIVSFPPGGATDVFSRTAAAELTRTLGQPMTVENRPGAGTVIASELVVKSPPDGYTLLFTDLSTHAITRSIYPKLSYDPLRDFAPVAVLNASPLLLVAHPSVKAKNVADLVAIAKRSPGITMGNSGLGTVTHMTAEKFRLRAGIQTTPVSYKGGALPVIALLGGEIAMVMATVPASIEHVRSGKLVALGLAAPKRSAQLPDIPALSETVPGVEGAVVSGVLAPSGTPQPIIDRLNAEFGKVSDTATAKSVYAANGAETMRMTPAEMQRWMEREAQEWADVVKATGFRMNN